MKIKNIALSMIFIVAVCVGLFMPMTASATELGEVSSQDATQTQVETADSNASAIVNAATLPDYEIRVNRVANCVTVYMLADDGTAVPYRSFACSVGKDINNTPLGTFYTSDTDYYDWRLMVDGTQAQYAVRIYKGILFHSVPYYTKSPDNLETDQFNLLGQNASLGCIRLACSDAKWIYQNCKPGTKVVIYDDATNPGPLGKPVTFTIDANHPLGNWDPTDDNALNPWNTIRPSIKLTRDMGDGVLYVREGATLEDLKAQLGVVSASGIAYNAIDYELYVNGNYDLSRFGVYIIWVKAITADQIVTEQQFTLAVTY